MSPHWRRTPLDLLDAILRIMEKRNAPVTPVVTERNA
jgi:hypothetical protein